MTKLWNKHLIDKKLLRLRYRFNRKLNIYNAHHRYRKLLSHNIIASDCSLRHCIHCGSRQLYQTNERKAFNKHGLCMGTYAWEIHCSACGRKVARWKYGKWKVFRR